MSSWGDCIRDIQAAVGRPLKDSEIEAIAQAVQVRMAKAKADGLSARDAAQKVGKEMTVEQSLAAMLQRREAADNILKFADAKARMVVGDEAKSEQALLGGRVAGGRGNGDSIDANHHSLRASILGPMVAALAKAKLLSAVLRNDRGFNLDVARELYRRNMKDAIAGTGNKHAEAVAEILGKAMDVGRAMQNKAGAFISELDNYMGRQYHDMFKVRGAGKEGNFGAWRDFIRPMLVVEKMAPGLTTEQRESALKEAWKGLAFGVHDGATNEALAGFTGPANLGKKVSQARSLIFKDADSWFAYNEKFGKGTVMDAVWASADGAARATATMQKLGTNPEAMFKRLHDANLQAAVDRSDGKMVDKLKGNPNQGMLDGVTGKSSIPGNQTWAYVGSTVRNVMQLKSLGGVLLSALPDVGATSATLRANGIPLWQALSHQLAAIMPQGERALELAHASGAGIDGMTGHIVNRFRSEDGVPGGMTKAINVLHKINGLTYWTEAQKVGMASSLTNNLAFHAGKEFNALPPLMQDTLRRYSIEAAEWDVGRATAQKMADGWKHLMPLDIPDETVSQKFHTYVIDQIREGMNEPTALSRQITTLGTQSGTVGGEVVRSFMQFKGFTATYMERHLGRVLYRGTGIDYPGFIYLAVGMSLAGLAANTLRDAIANKFTPTTQTPGGWANVAKAAISGGGAFGVLGDAVFRDSATTSGDVARSFAGPAITSLYDALAAVHAVTSKATDASHSRKDTGDVALQQMQKLLGSYIPNHPVIAAANGYLFGHALQEMVNPGATRRYNTLLKSQGKEQILRPVLQN